MSPFEHGFRLYGFAFVWSFRWSFPSVSKIFKIIFCVLHFVSTGTNALAAGRYEGRNVLYPAKTAALDNVTVRCQFAKANVLTTSSAASAVARQTGSPGLPEFVLGLSAATTNGLLASMVVLDPPFGLNKAEWDGSAMTPDQLVDIWLCMRNLSCLKDRVTVAIYCQPWEHGGYREALIDKCGFSKNFQVRGLFSFHFHALVSV